MPYLLRGLLQIMNKLAEKANLQRKNSVFYPEKKPK
jgi:hypothetical protein